MKKYKRNNSNKEKRRKKVIKTRLLKTELFFSLLFFLLLFFSFLLLMPIITFAEEIEKEEIEKATTNIGIIAVIKEENGKIVLEIKSQTFLDEIINIKCEGYYGYPLPGCAKTIQNKINDEISLGVLFKLSYEYQKVVLLFNNLLEMSEFGKVKIIKPISFNQDGKAIIGKIDYNGPLVFFGDLISVEHRKNIGYFPILKNDFVAVGNNFILDIASKLITTKGVVGIRLVNRYVFFDAKGKENNMKVEVDVRKDTGYIDMLETTQSFELGNYDVFVIPKQEVEEAIKNKKELEIDEKEKIGVFCGPSDLDELLKEKISEELWKELLMFAKCKVETTHPCLLPGPFKFKTNKIVGVIKNNQKLNVCTKEVVSPEGKKLIQFSAESKDNIESMVAKVGEKTFVNPTADTAEEAVIVSKDDINTEKVFTGDRVIEEGNTNVCITGSSLAGAYCLLSLTAVSLTPEKMGNAISNIKQLSKHKKKEGFIDNKKFESYVHRPSKIEEYKVFSFQNKDVTSVRYLSEKANEVLNIYDLDSDGISDKAIIFKNAYSLDDERIKEVDEKILKNEDIKIPKTEVMPGKTKGIQDIFDSLLEEYTGILIQVFYERRRVE